MESNLYCPFSISPLGSCPNCFGTDMVLLEKDIEASMLSPQGVIEKTVNISNESKLFCTTCNEEFDYIRRGLFYQPISESGKRLNEIIKNDNIDKSTKNPFSI